jgi:hypothetical protein
LQFLSAAIGSTTVRAGTVYRVRVDIGGDTVSGPITTDGTAEQLTESDIMEYSLSDSESRRRGGFLLGSDGDDKYPRVVRG